MGVNFSFFENSSFRRWFDQTKSGKVAHAQLIVSRNGGLAWPAALSYIKRLVCDESKPSGEACNICDSCIQASLFSHPDVHYVFPISGGEGASSKTSDHYLPEFRTYLKTNPFPVFKNWVGSISAQKKILQIGVKEASLVLGKLSLKSHSGKYKILVLWLPEKLSSAAANKLLKTIEEPNAKTLLLLVTHNLSGVLPTIVSRCLVFPMPPLGENGVERWLKQERNVAPDTAQVLSKMSYGDPGLALDYLENRENLKVFAEAFVSSMKISFKKDFHGLHDWVEDLGSWGRGQTQEYFSFCAALISQIAKYKSIGGGAVMLDWFPEVPFKTEGFSRILKYNSLPTIMSVYDEGKIDVGRNLNSKIILFDTGIKMMAIL